MSRPEPTAETGATRAHSARVRVWWWTFSISVLIALVCGVILIAGMIRREDGAPLIEDTGAVLLGAVGAFGALLSLVAPKLEAIRHQVQNSHGTNLRDDIDTVLSEIRGVRKDVGRLDDRLTYTQARLDKVIDHVDELEDTLNPKGHP